MTSGYDFLDRLRDDIERLPGHPDRRRSRRGRRRGMLAVATATTTVLIGLGAAFVAENGWHADETSAPRSRPVSTQPLLGALQERHLPLGANPFGRDGKAVTLRQVIADTPYPIPLPHSPAANPSSVTKAWEDTSDHSVALYFSDSRIEMLVSTMGGLDPTGSPTQRINGATAVVLPGTPNQNPPSPSRVMLMMNGHLVTLFATLPANKLVAVARTLSLP
jgi:hypothetical protein